MTFNTAAKAMSLSALVMPVFSDTADTKSAFLKFTTSSLVDDVFVEVFLDDFFVDDFFVPFLTAYSAEVREAVDVERDDKEGEDDAPFSPLDPRAGAVAKAATCVGRDAMAAMATTQRRSARRIILPLELKCLRWAPRQGGAAGYAVYVAMAVKRHNAWIDK